MPNAGPPRPTLLYRLVHVDNLATLLTRAALHARNSTPNDGLPYRTIHNPNVQVSRPAKPITCGPGGWRRAGSQGLRLFRWGFLKRASPSRRTDRHPRPSTPDAASAVAHTSWGQPEKGEQLVAHACSDFERLGGSILRPEGPPQRSPGQRPGFIARPTNPEPCKGRHKPLSRPFRAEGIECGANR